jgi:hypothetical protein
VKENAGWSAKGFDHRKAGGCLQNVAVEGFTPFASGDAFKTAAPFYNLMKFIKFIALFFETTRNPLKPSACG